ncbi:MAG: homoserine dehydrogenase [Oscillospiraceae bacterium]|nr:homoserine dehydrogenase [Oscillospiraceae bacterium]
MKVAVLGYGTVGKGVYEMVRSAPGLECGPVLVLPHECTEPFMVTDIEDIVSDGSVDAVVEAMGGVEPAASFAEKVIRSGKHFVTSNKAMVAEKGIELADLAREKGKAFLFSAACGGGVPILHNLSVAVKSDRITGIRGILNGTTNYILDAMQSEGMGFDEALARAKALGYAEADPSADLSGMDSFRKILLACAVAYGRQPSSAKDVEGIYEFTAKDAQVINGRGGAVRLIASGGLNENGSVYAFVEPVIFFDGMEKSVRKNFNCVSYTGERAGLITLFGQGAGRYPTASAVLRDLTGIMDGTLEMMPHGCVRTEERNLPQRRYLVRCDSDMASRFSATEEWHREADTVWIITDLVPAEEMHDKVRSIRKEGRNVFFASVE